MPKRTIGSGIRHSTFVINQRAALGILACALTALVYQSALDLPFVFDDRNTVLLSSMLVDPWDLRAVLLGDFPRTAVHLSYAVDRAFWGFSSFGFHLTNFALHIIVVGLFYGWCTRALADAIRSDPGLTPAVEWPAFFAAAAFGLHPVMSATAFYVSARPEMLCAAAFLIALMFARRAIVTSSTAFGLLAAGFGALAFGSSPAGAALPLVLIAYDRWLLGRPGWIRRMCRVYFPALAAAAGGLVWQLYAWAPISVERLPEVMLTESIVAWRNLALLVVPWGQAVVHEARLLDSLADPVALLAGAGIVGTLAGAIWLRRIAPLVSVGAVWFFAATAATLTVALIPDLMAEKQVYLAAAGLIMAVFTAVARPLGERRGARIAAAALLAIFALLTTMRSRVWNDPLALWTEAVTREPGYWQAHLEFAETLKEAGRCDRAVEEFATAKRLNPHLPLAPETGWAPCPPPRLER